VAVATTTIAYHVTSSLNRDSIAKHGLDWRQMGHEPGTAGSRTYEAEGVFLVFDRFDADWFVQMGKRRHPRIDIWEVTIDDLDEDTAPAPSDALWREIHGYSYYTQPIPATKLKLVASDL
jgi:hypothetical protein